MSRMQERLRALSEEDMQALTISAIVGVVPLAWELERVGLSDEDDSLIDAAWARPVILRTVEAARKGAVMSSEDRWWRRHEVLKALSEEDMQCLIAAGIVGHDALAWELERVGMCSEANCSEFAAWARRLILAAVEWEREERRRRRDE